jgi:hypothetical protein
VLSLGVNGVAAVVMMLVFAQTGGLTGAEVAVAGGASAVGHALLEALLGDQAIRSLAVRARDALTARVAQLYDQEAVRYEAALAAIDVDEAVPHQLRGLADILSRAVLPDALPGLRRAPAAGAEQ